MENKHIRHRFSGNSLYEYPCSMSIKEAVIDAVGKKIDLRGSNLRGSNLRGSNLRGSNLRGSDLRGSDLRGSDLRYSDLSYSDLRGSDLRYSDLSYSDLRGSDLSYSDLSYSDLRGSDLRGSNLRGSDLRGSDLSYSDLRGSDLSVAETDKRYIQISCIGSAKRMTTYCFEDDQIWCGCFKGTLEEFENKVNETHKDNEQYLKEYMGFINYLKSLK